MANCRCGEISSCTDKITTLNNALKNISDVDANIQTVNEDTATLKERYPITFESENNEELETATININQDLIAVKANIISKINEKISELEETLKKLQEEDEQYHREEEEKNK